MKYYGITIDGKGTGAGHTFDSVEDAQAQIDEWASRFPAKTSKFDVRVVEILDVPSALFQTNAPESYDGFGTRTKRVLGNGSRIVDVQDAHADWQEGRYASGMYRMTAV